MNHDDAPGYDAAALQAKWLPIWEQLKPFASGDPADKRPRQCRLADVRVRDQG